MRPARRRPWCAGPRSRNARPAGTPRPRRRAGRVDGQRTAPPQRSRQPVGEVGSISGPEGDALTLLAGEDPIAVVLHLVQPARTGGRMADEGRGAMKTGRRVAPKTRETMPRHVPCMGEAGPERKAPRPFGTRPPPERSACTLMAWIDGLPGVPARRCTAQSRGWRWILPPPTKAWQEWPEKQQG